MEATLANHVECDKPATAQVENSLVIVRGPYRTGGADWAAIHAITLQGYFAIRKGNDVLVHYAEVEEGNA